MFQQVTVCLKVAYMIQKVLKWCDDVLCHCCNYNFSHPPTCCQKISYGRLNIVILLFNVVILFLLLPYLSALGELCVVSLPDVSPFLFIYFFSSIYDPRV